jgi:hypothetical protein
MKSIVHGFIVNKLQQYTKKQRSQAAINIRIRERKKKGSGGYKVKYVDGISLG